MRIPVALAWLLIVGTFFTSGLLRRFHELTPQAPNAPTAVGSLLFAAILFLLLVAAREWRLGASPGPGIRFGSITPLLLMLLVEKWVSTSLYIPVFDLLVPEGAGEAIVDAWFRAFAGAGLLAIALLVAQFSRPAARRTVATCRPRTLAAGLGLAALIVGATYLVVAALALGLGVRPALIRAPLDNLGLWVVGGQALRSLGEEIYYRGLILWEMERLAPRLGARSPVARRWLALIPAALLFGMEHATLGARGGIDYQQLLFAAALGVLLGMIVLSLRNLGVVWGIHTWINLLLLGPVPHFVDAEGSALIPSGSYIGIALALSFVAVWWLRGRKKT